MKQFVLAISLLSTLVARADLGLPSVQAICKVTTSNGKSYEGFVTLMIGGLHGVHQNGFYLYLDDHYNWIIHFDLEFNKLEKIGVNKYRFGSFVPDAKRIYFVAYTRDNKTYWLNETTKEVQESNKRFIIEETVIHRKYVMLDTLPLFTELPKYLHLDYNDKKLKRHNIPMKDIVSFEILTAPSEVMLTEIERKRKELAAEARHDDTGDFVEPVWVHEMVKEPDELERLKEDYRLSLRK